MSHKEDGVTVNKDGSVPIIPAALSLARAHAHTHRDTQTRKCRSERNNPSGKCNYAETGTESKEMQKRKRRSVATWGVFALHPVSKFAMTFSSLLQNTPDD